jgi:hypothetical protein
MVGFRRPLVFVAILLLCASSLYGIVRSAENAPPARLGQGWSTVQEQAFYHMPQGTVIMPASWLAALQTPDGQPFMAPEHMRALGFIPDPRQSLSNPYGWPIGFAINPAALTGGLPTAGLTCAACHTSVLTYKGKAVLVDGGQASIDLDAFKQQLAASLGATLGDPARRAAFEKRAVDNGFPQDRIAAALDARAADFKANAVERAKIVDTGTKAGPGRNDALAAIALQVFNTDLGVPSNVNQATGPVDFPYLWDIGKLYWVQYNGSVHQPMARNIGEALGVGAVTNFVNPATGGLNPEPARWRTSIPVRNLYAIESLIEKLAPPHWPADAFGALDRARVARGRTLFAMNCAACHGVRMLAGKTDTWSVKVIALRDIGTDPRQADNFAHDTYDATKLGLSAKTTGGEGLRVVTSAIRTQAYTDSAVPQSEWGAYDGHGRKNVLTEPCGYKARPLVGVWSTPPFLHNGSVPTIYDLLSESRPATFHTGATEYDPVHLGFVDASGPHAFTIDTSIAGNSNAGHWFTDERSRTGRIGRKFSDAEKLAIIEYLKAATYADYPRTTVAKPDPEPCVDDAKAYPEHHA